MPVNPLHERRQNRLTLSLCPKCGRDSAAVATRTEYVIYIRCHDCAHIWVSAKPNAIQLSYSVKRPDSHQERG